MPKHLTTIDIDTAEFVLPTQIGEANGVAALDGTGKVPLGQLPTIAAGSVTSVNGKTGIVSLVAGDVNAVGTSQVGMASGVASLDPSGFVPLAQLPGTVLSASSIGAHSGVAGLDSGGFLDLTHVHTNTANGLTKLDGSGLVPAAQSLIKSVNGDVGVVSLAASDVGAVDAAAVGVANGVAGLNSSAKVPEAQLPDLSNLYVPVPGAVATAAGQFYTSTGPGSNSATWTTPLVYTAVDQAHRPVSPPTGSVVTQTDINADFVYGGSQWFRLNADIGIPKYVSAAARDVDFPTPADGQHIYRTDLHQLFWYNGSSWLPVTQGTWTAYTPAWTSSGTQPTLGNGSLTGWYSVVGKTCNVALALNLGTTSIGGTGTYSFSLPFASASHSNIRYMGSGTYIITAGGTNYPGNVYIVNGASTMQMVIFSSGVSFTGQTLGQAYPGGITTSAVVDMSITYQIA